MSLWNVKCSKCIYEDWVDYGEIKYFNCYADAVDHANHIAKIIGDYYGDDNYQSFIHDYKIGSESESDIFKIEIYEN